MVSLDATPHISSNPEKDYEIPIYGKRDINIVRGEGIYLWDSDNTQYLDCISGIGVACLGHSHPKYIAAVKEQLETLVTCPEIFYSSQRGHLLQKLIDLSPPELSQVYLCNSGTEAVEAAIKFARLTTGKTEIIAMMRGFHGRTMGSLSVTYNPKYRQGFEPLIPNCKFVPFNKLDTIEAEITENTAGIILEIIQGNGGIHVADREYIRQLRQLCDEKNILLILDEIQTGIGRTGSMFAFEQFDIVPDMVCIAKALGGGIPIGAVIANSKITVSKGKHGSTFGGNPLSAAAAVATLDILQEENLIEHADKMGDYFLEQLNQISSSKIRSIRGLGLMIGVELKKKAGPYIQVLQDQGVLVNSAGSTVIRFLPPLIITKKQIDEIISIFSQVLSD